MKPPVPSLLTAKELAPMSYVFLFPRYLSEKPLIQSSRILTIALLFQGSVVDVLAVIRNNSALSPLLPLVLELDKYLLTLLLPKTNHLLRSSLVLQVTGSGAGMVPPCLTGPLVWFQHVWTQLKLCYLIHKGGNTLASK